MVYAASIMAGSSTDLRCHSGVSGAEPEPIDRRHDDDLPTMKDTLVYVTHV